MWKMVGTSIQAEGVQQVLEMHGCWVEVYVEEQSAEQSAERHRRVTGEA